MKGERVGMKLKSWMMLGCLGAALLGAKEFYPEGNFESAKIKPLHIRRFDYTSGKSVGLKPNQGVTERVQNEKAYSGKQSLLLESTVQGTHSLNLHNIKVTPGKKYEFSWRYFVAEKSEKVSVSGRVIFTKDNKPQGFLFPTGDSDTGRWHQVKVLFYPPAGCEKFSTTIWIGRGKFKVYLDDLKVTEFDEGKTKVADSNTLLLKKADGVTIWKQSNYRRIDAHAVPEEIAKADKVQLTAAANEMEPFQLAVFPEKELKDVSITISDLKGKAGVIPAKAQSYGILLYVHLKNPANPTLKGDMADPMVDKVSTDAPARKNTIFYVRIFAPAGTKAGLYKGSVTLKAGKKVLAVVPVELTVRSFALPEVPNLRTFFYGAPGVTKRLYNDPRPFEKVRENFLKIYKNHRIDNHCIHPGLPKYEIKNGRLIVTDWSEFDKQTREYYKQGKRSFTVPGLGMLGDNGRWFGGKKGPRVFGKSIDSEEGRQLAGDYARQFHEHWQKLALPGARYYSYIYDEPAAKAYKRLNAFTSAVLKHAPGFRFFVTHRMDPELKNITVHCIPFGPGHIFPELEKGKENFYYNWGQPLDHRNYIKSRLYAWQIVANGGQGGLMWQTAATPGPHVNPWTDLDKVHRSGPVATTIFPALTKGGEFVPTLRLAQVREAVDDADYLFILRNKVEKRFPGMGQKYLLSRIKDLIPELPFGFINDSELLYSVRARLGDEIENFDKEPVVLVTSTPDCFSATEISTVEIQVRGPKGAQVFIRNAKAGTIGGKLFTAKVMLNRFGLNVIPVKITYKGSSKSYDMCFTLKRDANLIELEKIVKELKSRKIDAALFEGFIKKSSSGSYTAAMRQECAKLLENARRTLLKSRLAVVKKSKNPLVNAANEQAAWMFKNKLYPRTAYYLDLAKEFTSSTLSSKSKLSITPVKIHGNFGYRVSNGIIEFTLLEVGGRIVSFKVKGVECFAARKLDKTLPLAIRAGKDFEKLTHLNLPDPGGYEDAGLEVLPESSVDWDISVKEISDKRIALEASMLMRGNMFRISRIMSIVPGKPELKIDYTISNVFPSEFKSDDPTHYHFCWRGRLSPMIGDNSQGDKIEVPTLKKLKETCFDVKKPIFYEERSVELTKSYLGSWNAGKKIGFDWNFDPSIRHAYLWFSSSGDHNGKNKMYTLEIFRSFYGNKPGVTGNSPFYIEPGKSVNFSMSFTGRTEK